MLKAPRPPGSLAKGVATSGDGRSHVGQRRTAGGLALPISKEQAEALALQGLSFLAGDADD